MASPTKYIVKLTEEQRRALRKMIGSGEARARKLIRARVLLKADESEGDAYDDEQIKKALEVSTRTIQRVRKAFARGGFDAALNRQPQPARPDKRRLDGAAEARLVQLACSKVPAGHASWTLDLLTDRMIALNVVPVDPGLSRDTVRRVLKKRAQALAERDVVHRARAIGRLRLENGGRAGRVPSTLRSGEASRVPGRKERATDRRHPGTAATRTRHAGEAGPRV